MTKPQLQMTLVQLKLQVVVWHGGVVVRAWYVQ